MATPNCVRMIVLTKKGNCFLKTYLPIFDCCGLEYSAFLESFTQPTRNILKKARDNYDALWDGLLKAAQVQRIKAENDPIFDTVFYLKMLQEIKDVCYVNRKK